MNVRLTQQEKKQILKVIEGFDPEAKVYLFGSRLDAKLKGGDIDLMIV